jgi:pilus assembly protein Flp/PilA
MEHRLARLVNERLLVPAKGQDSPSGVEVLPVSACYTASLAGCEIAVSFGSPSKPMTMLDHAAGTLFAYRFASFSAYGSVIMKRLLKSFWADETAATAIEYGLIATGIAIAIIAAVKGVGTKLSGTFNSISGSLK